LVTLPQTKPPVHTSPEPPKPHGPFAALRRAVPTGEVIRFLLVGAFNTLFSLVLYSGFVILYSRVLPHSSKPLIADLASICSKPIAISVAFFCYKHFVFRTHGNYLKELLRCFAVYGVSTPAELLILPIATHLFLHPVVTHPYAPFLAGVVNAVIIASYSYFAHKKFSFKR
jgi:putative flippase GtrA